MANEPSWEDIFNPRPSEPAAQPSQPAQPIEPPTETVQYEAVRPQGTPPVEPPPLVEPAQAAPVYPPTQAYPTFTAEPVLNPEQSAYPQQSAHPQEAAPLPVAHPTAPAAEAVAQSDPFAGLFGPAATTGGAESSPMRADVEPSPAPTAAAAATSAPADDPFFALFGERAPLPGAAASAPTVARSSAPTDDVVTSVPLSRREMRDGGGSGGGRGNSGRGDGSGGDKPRKKRSLLWLKIALPIVVVLGGAGGVAAFAWVNYEEQVRELLGWQLPTDYETTGNGEEVIVTIHTGDLGSDIAQSLHDAGVTMTFDAFYDLLLTLPEDPGFVPGNYSLEKEMSAQSALDALLDPENKVTDRLLITEGTTLPNALEIIAETTGIPLEELQESATDLASFGLPAEAPSLEGYLFPATYQLDGGQTAHDILQLLVDTMFERLDDAGVPVEDRHRVLTMAALIQRESGPNTEDFYKISRVFTNRLEQGINLESDATVAYGADTLHTVWTTDEDRANAGNLYNTYANPGLPIGPIGAPGDLAIDAALHPADGPWLFFVPINLATGETVFSVTADEHEAAADQLRAWCRESEENASYCE